MLDVVDKKNLPLFKEKLDEIDPKLWEEMDTSEVLLLYPHVRKRMRNAGFNV